MLIKYKNMYISALAVSYFVEEEPPYNTDASKKGTAVYLKDHKRLFLDIGVDEFAELFKNCCNEVMV